MFLTFKITKNMEQENLTKVRHSLSHLLAGAVLAFYPDTKLATGPAIDNGFYYDFEFSAPISDKDLGKIEQKMRELLKKWSVFEKKKISINEARELFANNPYKLELISDLEKENSTPTIYISGDLPGSPETGFTDLCAGPHVNTTKEIPTGTFKLDRIAGAYWKGDEKNIMLTRIYGLAFETKEKLEEYINQQEEAKKRDHRKLGKELDLFCFSDLVGPGLPLYTPKGTIIIDELQKHIEAVCRKYGFEKVKTPHLAKRILFETSGHATKFADELFAVTSPKGHQFNLKPVQCPMQTQIYASKIRTYKELPIRYMESDRQYRAEKTGEVGGLSRVYAITCEDGHSFCRVDQVKQEVVNMVNIIKDFYTSLGLWKNNWVSLSVRDYAHPEKYIGDTKDWDLCESMLQEISDEMGLKAKKCEGEAALYGPKLDFMFKDAMGKEIQIPTVQLDFATPKRFGLTYIDNTGKETSPVMVHRAVLGSYERFLVLLIEHFAGNFPLWLSPVQIKIIPVRENHNEYAKKIADELRDLNIRVDFADSDEGMGKKIREGKNMKVPYMLVIGDKEIESGELSLEIRDGTQTKIALENLKAKLVKETKERI
jgi:threonyl-tRNA synthetase